MPDDPQAKARLDAAVERVRRVFSGMRGSANWGDGIPHHPDQRPGMSERAIEALHRRPAELPASALSPEEVYYFFSHAGYRMNPRETLSEALPYFLPRLAEFLACPEDSPFVTAPLPLMTCERLALVRWERWAAAKRAAVREWLAAWGEAVVHWQCERWAQDGVYLGPWDPEHRQVDDCLPALLVAAVPEILDPALERLGPAGWVRLVRGLLPFGQISLESEDYGAPEDRWQALLKRLGRREVAEAVASAAPPPGVDPADWEDACTEAAATVELVRLAGAEDG